MITLDDRWNRIMDDQTCINVIAASRESPTLMNDLSTDKSIYVMPYFTIYFGGGYFIPMIVCFLFISDLISSLSIFPRNKVRAQIITSHTIVIDQNMESGPHGIHHVLLFAN